MANSDWQTIVEGSSAPSDDGGGWQTIAKSTPIRVPPEEPPSWYEKNVPTVLKDAAGGIESVGRMLPNVFIGAGSYAGAAGLGILSGDDLSEAHTSGTKAMQKTAIEPFSVSGHLADELLGDAYHGVKTGVQDINTADISLFMQSPAFQKLPKSEQAQWYRAEAKQSEVVGAGFDAVLYLSGILGRGKALKAAEEIKRQKEQRRLAEEAAKQPEITFEGGSSVRNRPEDIVTSGHRGYEDAGLGGAAEMANVPTIDRMANQEPRRPNETLPFDPQDPQAQPTRAGEFPAVVEQAGQQVPELGGEIRAKPGFLRSAEEVYNERISRIPRGQRGGALIPFGKSAEALRDFLGERKQEIKDSIDRIGDAFKKRQITSAHYWKRREELNIEVHRLDQRILAAADAIKKAENPALNSNEPGVSATSKVLPFVPKGQRGHIGDWAKRPEKDVIIEAQKGDQRAFSELFNRNKGPLERQLHRFERDPDILKDRIQETFQSAFENLASFRGDSKFSTWLYTIGRNKIKNSIGDRERHQSERFAPEAEHDVPSHQWSPEEHLIDKQNQTEMQKALDTLHPRIKEAFELWDEGKTYEEIAAAQDVPVNTVRSRISRARDALDKQLNEGKGPNRGSTSDMLGLSTLYDTLSKKWDRKITSQGLTKTMLDAKREIAIEKRDLPKILEEDKQEFDLKNIQDIAPESEGKWQSWFKQGMSKLLIDRTMARLSRERPGSRTLIKWEVDRRELIDNKKDINIRDSLKEGLHHWISKATGHTLEVREMLQVWHDNVGKSALTRESFKNEKQWKMFERSHQVMDKLRDTVNETRVRFNKDPLPYIENYFPAIWEGDYRINVYDQAGTKIYAVGLKTTWGANKVVEAFRKEHPELDVRDAQHVPEREQYHDLSAFEEALRIHSSNHPATRALQQTYSNLLKTRGMGAHGLYREGVLGFLGMEPGQTGVKNSQKAFEIYTKRVHNHIANLEKNDLAMQVDKIPEEIASKIPHTMAYLKETLNLAKGVDLSEWGWVDKKLEGLGEASGLGRSFAGRAIRETASVASLAMLSTVRFLAMQPFQPLNAMAKLQQLRIRVEDVRNMPESMLRGLQGELGEFARDRIQNEAVDWANKNEKLQSTIIDLAGMRMTDPTTSSTSKVGNTVRLIHGGIEKNSVRLPAFLAFEYALRDATPDKITRFEQAAALMDYEMVHYDLASSPRIYGEMGLVGDAARPLKTYSHNAWGRFFEYAQGAKNHGEFTPLAVHMGTQLAVGGIRGLIGLAEATVLINLINTIWPNADVPTPTEVAMKYFPKLMKWFGTDEKTADKLSDYLLFGIPSTMFGLDLSGTVTAPTIPQMFGVFPVAIAGKAVWDTGALAFAYAQGEHTDADVLRFLQSTSPAAMREFWTEMFAEPGKPAPHASMEMGGTYVRDASDKNWALLSGLKSIPEARADEFMRSMKQLFLKDQEQKHNALRAITDRVVNNKQITPDLLQQYVKEGGDPRNLNQSIKDELIKRSLPWMDKQLVGKSISPDKAHKLQMMKEELDREFKRRQQAKQPDNDTLMPELERQDPLLQSEGETKGLKNIYDSHAGRPSTNIEIAQHRKRAKEFTESGGVDLLTPGVTASYFHAPINMSGAVYTQNTRNPEKPQTNNMLLNTFYGKSDKELADYGIKDPAPGKTIMHEQEHLLGGKQGVNINRAFDVLLGKTVRVPQVERALLVGRFVEHAPELEKRLGFKLDAYFDPDMLKQQGARAPYLLSEQLATLSANERKTGKFLVNDPYVREHILNTKDLRETYSALTGSRQTRLDSKDLPPHTRVPEVPEAIDEDFLRQREGRGPKSDWEKLADKVRRSRLWSRNRNE